MFNIVCTPLTQEVLHAFLLIAMLRICDVTLGITRLIMIGKGMRVQAMIAGFCEVSVWIQVCPENTKVS